MLSTILIVILILLLIGAFPTWGYSRAWGYFPSGILGVVLVIVIILVADRVLATLSTPRTGGRPPLVRPLSPQPGSLPCRPPAGT